MILDLCLLFGDKSKIMTSVGPASELWLSFGALVAEVLTARVPK